MDANSINTTVYNSNKQNHEILK